MSPRPSLLLIVLALAACRTAAPAAPPRAKPPAPIPLLRTTVDPGMFPARWHRRGVEVRATPLPAARRATAEAWLAQALAAYPAGFVAQQLRGIYVLGSLSFRGVRAGGSNSRRRIYVVLPAGSAAQRYFERVVHAELSSVLLRRYPQHFDQADWLRGTIPGFRYGASGAAAVRHGLAAAWPTPWTLKQGFLYEYGMSSVENDLNSYAGFLFAHPERLRAFAARYPGIAHKRALTLRFYRALDARFARLGGKLPVEELRRERGETEGQGNDAPKARLRRASAR